MPITGGSSSGSSGVSSLSKSGSALLTGDVTLTGGSNVTLTQSGQDISLSVPTGLASPLTTKGDLWGFSSTNARIPVGSNTQVLIADSTQTLGVKWGTATSTSAIGTTVTSGTTGSILFIGSGPVLAQDNATLFWDTTNKRLGIGTASPTDALTLINGNFVQTQGINPTVRGSLQDATNIQGPGTCYISGKYAYIAVSTANRLTIIDVSNPAAPVLVGTVQDNTNLNGAATVTVSGQYAYIGANGGALFTIVDVSDPAVPVVTGSVGGFSGVYGIYVSGKYAYVSVSNTSNSVYIVDITDPSAPFIAKTLTDGTNLGATFGVFVQGRYAYFSCFGSSRLTVVDIMDPLNPVVVGSLLDATNLISPVSLFVSGKYAYVGCYSGNRLSIVNIADPTNPTLTGTLLDNTNLALIQNIYVSGNYAYVSSYNNNALTIIDVSNPAAPVLAGTISDGTNLIGANGVFVSGKFVYVTSSTGNRLTVVEINGIKTPGAAIGNISTDNISVNGNIDISNNLYIHGGLNIGINGILNDGPETIGGNTILNKKITKYNKITTSAWGVPSIYGYLRPAQQVNSLVTLATYTVGAADGSFMVSGNINVTIATASLIGMSCTYTDESNTSRVLVLNFSNIAGVFATATTLNTTGAFEGVPVHIRAKTGTTITLATTGTVTTATYTAEGIITQCA
jgi:hypothetical protein